MLLHVTKNRPPRAKVRKYVISFATVLTQHMFPEVGEPLGPIVNMEETEERYYPLDWQGLNGLCCQGGPLYNLSDSTTDGHSNGPK